MIKGYIKFLKTLMLHKWYVMKSCFKLGLYWRGLIHDWSKLSSQELPGYVARFGGDIKKGRDKSGYYDPTVDAQFMHAWGHHVHFNAHHWQHHVIPRDNLPDGEPLTILKMPEKCALEMICDWWSASKAYSTKPGNQGILDFYVANKDKLRLHPETRKYVEENLERVAELLGP